MAVCRSSSVRWSRALLQEARHRSWLLKVFRSLGVVVLEDVLKPAMSERFERLRRMGLRTVMITGDNPLTAATIAQKAGVDDFLAQATPEDKLATFAKSKQKASWLR